MRNTKHEPKVSDQREINTKTQCTTFFCNLRELQLAMEAYEKTFEQQHGITLKEGMLICCVSQGEKKAGDIAANIDLSCSNCSKIITSAENKGLLMRSIGSGDKRNMLFSLTQAGTQKLDEIKESSVEAPEILKKALNKEAIA